MKSPIYDGQSNYGLSHSTVTDNRFSKSSYSDSFFSQNSPARLNKSNYPQYVTGWRQNNKNETIILRNTICVTEQMQENSSKKNYDKNLRNTSYFNQNQYPSYKYQPNKSDKNIIKDTAITESLVKSVRQPVNYGQNFENSKASKIREEIDKKQRIINKLKQISQFKQDSLKQQLKSPNSIRKTNADINHYRNTPKETKYHNDGYGLKSELTASYQHLAYKNQIKSNYLREKLDIRAKEKKQTEGLTQKKNPEEGLLGKQGFKKIKNSYFTPKQTKSQLEIKLEKRYTPKVQMTKTNSTHISSGQGNQLYLKNNSWNVSNSFSTYSPSDLTRTKTSQFKQSIKQTKINDVRNIINNKNLKNNSAYFSKRHTIYDFELAKSLGQGKFGVVYQAVHKETRVMFAIKKISKKMIKQNLMIDQLLQQIKIQSFCNHPNILKLFGVLDDSEHIYLILEYMQQGTLFTQLKKNRTLTEKQASIKLQEVASALVYLHDNGIVHRDIKPENVVMSNGHAKLCDFGWAAICTDRRKTYCGTFDYAAPEMLQGNEYDLTIDLWCLGVLAYELLVGKAPFYHFSRKETMKKIMNVEKTAIEFPSSLSKNAISFIESLIKKNPAERMNGQDILSHPFLASVVQIQL